MALETLKGVTEIDGFKVSDLRGLMDEGIFFSRELFYHDRYTAHRKEFPIEIDHKENQISFRIQNGPVKECGRNGCQVDTMIHTARLIIEGLNKKFRCDENEEAIYHLSRALDILEDRRIDRIERGVEGKNAP